MERGRSDWTKLLALKLFDHYNNRTSTKILLKVWEAKVYRIHFDKLPLLNSLPHASILVTGEVAACLE